MQPVHSPQTSEEDLVVADIETEAAIDTVIALAPQDYVLASGDRVMVTVYGESDLSGEYRIDPQGMISVPLIGDVVAVARTIADIEQEIFAKLQDGYLVHPRVSVSFSCDDETASETGVP